MVEKKTQLCYNGSINKLEDYVLAYNLLEISKGADGVFIENNRFNTTVISFNFYLPLSADSITENALLPYVLASCCEEYPDFTELNLKLSMLFGADISVTAEKIRDVQHIRIAVSAINDEYVLEKSTSVIKETMQLLLSLVFEPRLNGAALSETDVEREKRKLLEHIAGEFNDKRAFAKNRLTEIMFEGDAYGISKYGTLAAAKEVTAEGLYLAWKRMLESAYVRVQVIGKSLPEGVFELVGERLSAINRKNITDYSFCKAVVAADSVKKVTERFDVSQGKLVMGFSSEVCGENAYNFTVMADIFGGGPYSHLFENVREKMSLCYYCSASAIRSKGFLLVQSGVEAENADKAEKEILNQLTLVQNGEFTDFAFEASKKSIIGSLKSYNDSLYALDKWYASGINRNGLHTPEEVIDKISNVKREDVVAAAKGIKLHTVYKLLPKGEAE